MLPEFLPSFSGVANVTFVKRSSMVSCLAKCLLKLELIDGAGVIPEGRARKREAQVLLAVCQGNLKAFGLKGSAASAVTPAWETAVQGERPADTYRLG